MDSNDNDTSGFCRAISLANPERIPVAAATIPPTRIVSPTASVRSLTPRTLRAYD